MALRRLFDFRGETGRLGFLGGFLGWWTAFVVLALSLAAWGAFGGGSAPPYRTILQAGLILGVVVHIAGLLALQTRRLRSMGAPMPLVIAGVLLALGLLDTVVLTKITWLRMVWPMNNMTPLAGLAQLTLHLFLFLWPAKSRRAVAPDLAETFT